MTAFERPARFVDEQVRGPFRSMRHEHLFETRPDGGTRMTDRMQVESLLGGLGTRVLLAPYLRRLLQQRAGYIRARAEGD